MTDNVEENNDDVSCACTIHCDCGTCCLIQACGACATRIQTKLYPYCGISSKAFFVLFAIFEGFLVWMDATCFTWGMVTKSDFPGYDSNWILLDEDCTREWHDGTFYNGLFVTYLNAFGCIFNTIILVLHLHSRMGRTGYLSIVLGSTCTTFAVMAINWIMYVQFIADSGWNGCGSIEFASASTAFALYVQFTRWQYVVKCPLFSYMSIMALVNARDATDDYDTNRQTSNNIMIITTTARNLNDESQGPRNDKNKA
jgi:hypothetical protein